MPNKTAIGWTDRTSNPIYAVDKLTGKRGWFCTKVSEGCGNCYAETLNMRFGNKLMFTVLNSERVEWRLNAPELDAILRLRKPQRIFMCDMMDLFHQDVPVKFIAEIFDVMARAKQHTFQVLTKRPQRMRAWVNAIAATPAGQCKLPGGYGAFSPEVWPLPNVILMTSVENQETADQRLPELLATPAAMYGVSCEPLLGPLDFHGDRWLFNRQHLAATFGNPSIDWVIAGGMSGGPRSLYGERWLVERCECENLLLKAIKAPDGVPVRCSYCDGTFWRPKPEPRLWVRSIREQCAAAGVPLFFKQWGGPTPKAGGRTLDGRTWDEFPQRVAVPA